MSVATTYNVELRDKSGNLKTYLTPFTSDVSWEWNRLGGCGRCSVNVQVAYRAIDFQAGDDIQIRIESGATSKLVYRGYLANITPKMQISQSVKLDVRGYFDLIKKFIVHTSGDTRTYSDKSISFIVDDIVSTFITPNSSITKGTIDTTDGSSFVIDTIEFLTDTSNTLRTLADLAGDAEYGVDEDLVFFWRTENSSETHRFFVGNDVSALDRIIQWDGLINKIYLVGGDVAGVKYKKTGQDTDSQTNFYLSEAIINNSSIVTDSVANQFLTAQLKEKSIPQYIIKAQIKNTDLRIEDTIPLGQISFYDSLYDGSEITIGETADGGSNVTIGLVADGGTGVFVGNIFSDQVENLKYKLSDTDGRVNIDIQLGDAILETAAKIKRIELAVDSITQKD